MKKKLMVIIVSVMIVITMTPGSWVSATDNSGMSDTEQDEFTVDETLYNSTYKNNPGYELVGTKKQYFYYQRTKSTTTSGQASLSGWTKYDSKYTESVSGYKFGTPISTSESYDGGKKTVKSAVDKGYYYYAYSVANPSDTSDWTYYVAKSQSSVITHMKQNFSSSATWAEKRLRYFWYISSSELGSGTKDHFNKTIPYHKSSSVSVGTTTQTGTHYYDLKLWKYKQCYKEKTAVTVNYFYKWNEWKQWSNNWSSDRVSMPTDGSMKEESRTVYILKALRKTTPISDCNVEIVGPTTFTYDGDEKKIDIKITHNGEELSLGTDYVVSDNSAIDAGRHTAIIAGVNDYSGEVEVNYTIEQAPSILSFEKETVVLKNGTREFVNPLSAVTDGTIVYKSSDTKVAEVDFEGKVSIVGKGKARITATVEGGQNYSQADTSYEITVATSINECVLTQEEHSFIYDGSEKNIQFTLEDEDYLLQEGKDYTVSGNSGTDVGTYNVILEGIGNYGDQKELTLEITKAPSELSFDEATIIKRTNDEPFKNNLTAVTDGQISYKSDNEDIASVDANGFVTVKNEGTTTITATAKNGKNYKNGSASYSLNVKKAVHSVDLDDLKFGFYNTRIDFEYPEPYHIGSSIWRMIFGKVLGDAKYLSYVTTSEWGGNCAGMSSASALLFDPDNGINTSSFNPNVERIQQLVLSDMTTDGLSLRQFIEAMQIAQNASVFQETLHNFKVEANDEKDLNLIFNTIKTQTENGIPVLVAIGSPGTGAHALLAYKAIESDNKGKIFLYDSNDPMNEREIELVKDDKGTWINQWDYYMGERYGVWGTENGSTNWISIVPYGIIQKIWNERGEKLQKKYNTIYSSSDSIQVSNVDGEVIAKVEKGELIKQSKDVFVHEDELSLNTNSQEGIVLSMPVGVYLIKNMDPLNESFEINVSNSQLLAKVKTTASEIKAISADEYGLNNVYIDAGKNDKYDVTLESSIPGDKHEVAVSGKGIGETLEISQSDGAVNVENCQVMSMSIDGKENHTKSIRARSFGHGYISPSGTDKVVYGTDRIYTIEPEKGYQIQDVIVDDVSVGVVKSYIFKHVTEEHEIIAIFEPSSRYKKINNSIKASNITISSPQKERKIKLKVKTTGNTKILYHSNNKMIKVSKSGILTIKGNTIGKAKITITAVGNDYFNPATKSITVLVNPVIPIITNVKVQRGHNAAMRWKRQKNVTGYIVQYSTSPSFKNAKKIMIRNSKKTKCVVKKLKSNKKYYLRIRSYKKVNNRYLLSKWSNKRSIRTMK